MNLIDCLYEDFCDKATKSQRGPCDNGKKEKKEKNCLVMVKVRISLRFKMFPPALP